MYYLLAGPLVAIVGIVAVFFVLRRKSVEKRSMYSARRTQIEHKVRAARQRTLAGRGHIEKPAAAPAEASPFATQAAQTATYTAPAYEPPPVAPPPVAPQPQRQEEAPATMPWEQPSIPPPMPAPAVPEPASSAWDFPAAPAEPFAPEAPAEPYAPAPAFPSESAPAEQAWTPAPVPEEPAPTRESVAPAASSSSAAAAGSWSIVTTEKESAAAAEPEPKKKKGKREHADAGSPWALASGEAPGMHAEQEEEIKHSSGTLMAVAQYAVLVVGLVMVLIGVLVMVANSRVTP